MKLQSTLLAQRFKPAPPILVPLFAYLQFFLFTIRHQLPLFTITIPSSKFYAFSVMSLLYGWKSFGASILVVVVVVVVLTLGDVGILPV